MNHMALPIGSHAANATAATAAAFHPEMVGQHQNKPLIPLMQTLLMRNAAAAGDGNGIDSQSIYKNRHNIQARAQAQAHNQRDMNAAIHHHQNNVNRYHQKMANDFAMAQKLNRSLQQQLALKTSQAEDLKFLCYTENKRMKSTIETLETTSQAQTREIAQLRNELQQRQNQKCNSNNNNNNNNEVSTQPLSRQAVQGSNHGDNNDRVTQQYQQQLQQLQSTTKEISQESSKPDQSFVSWLVKSKSGCPLCLTLDHILSDCDILRSNGYLVTYHEFLDSKDSPSCSTNNTVATNRNNSTIMSAAAAINVANVNATINATIVAAAATAAATAKAAAEITMPTTTPTRFQEVIELLSDSDDDENDIGNTRKDREASTHDAAEAALHNRNDNSNSDSIDGILTTTPSVPNTYVNSTSISPPDSLEETRGKEQRYLASIQALQRRMIANSNEHGNNGDDNDGNDDNNRENAAHDEIDSEGTVTDEELDINVDKNNNNNNDADAEVDDEDDGKNCASDGTESDAIVADIPTSSEFDPRLRANCEFPSSSSAGMNDDRGGKCRPIILDFLDDENEETIAPREKAKSPSSRTTAEPDAETNYNKTSTTDEYEDDEIKIIGETGKNPLSDFAHPRYDCVIKPFSKDPEAFCPNCYCYVCDVHASECEKWKVSGDEEEESHCYAERKIVKWKRRRSKARSKRKLPERTLKNIAIFLKDTVPTKLPLKRKTRETIRYGQEGDDWSSDVQRSLRNRRKTR